jgi:DnaJ-domain-containing protein 1
MTSQQVFWTTRFLIGFCLLLLAGSGMPSLLVVPAADGPQQTLLDVLVGSVGFVAAFRSIGPLIRSLADDAELRRGWGGHQQRAFANASTAQQVHDLLLQVAATDGEVTNADKALVQTFLLRTFTDPRVQQQLRSWQGTTAAGDGRRTPLPALARTVGRGLDAGERATVYSWCCLIALQSRTFQPATRDGLQAIANSFRLGEAEAHLLFLFAHQMQRDRPHDNRERGSANQRTRSRQQEAPRPRPTPTRARALETLGLPAGATAEQIRKRHRELVRRFHPDRHRHLGEVAQREATERFRRIQQAYEQLGG